MDVGLVIWKEVSDDHEVDAPCVEEHMSLSAISVKVCQSASLTFASFSASFSSVFLPSDSDISYSSAIPKLRPSCIIFLLHHDVSNLFRIACRAASILLVLSWFCTSSSSIFLR